MIGDDLKDSDKYGINGVGLWDALWSSIVDITTI